jgi:hypothetical protein
MLQGVPRWWSGSQNITPPWDCRTVLFRQHECAGLVSPDSRWQMVVEDGVVCAGGAQTEMGQEDIRSLKLMDTWTLHDDVDVVIAAH